MLPFSQSKWSRRFNLYDQQKNDLQSFIYLYMKFKRCECCLDFLQYFKLWLSIYTLKWSQEYNQLTIAINKTLLFKRNNFPDQSENEKCVKNQSQNTSKNLITVFSGLYLAFSLNKTNFQSFPGIPGFPGNSHFPSRFPIAKN